MTEWSDSVERLSRLTHTVTAWSARLFGVTVRVNARSGHLYEVYTVTPNRHCTLSLNIAAP